MIKNNSSVNNCTLNFKRSKLTLNSNNSLNSNNNLINKDLLKN